jgi:hypothetical protein
MSGREKVAKLLLDFLKKDPASRPGFSKGLSKGLSTSERTDMTSRLLLLALLAVWMLIAWPHVSEQFLRTEQARGALAALSWEERAAAVDQPAYNVARDLAKTVPAGGCVLVVVYAGPEHLRYYRSRLPYYLYPRRVRFSDQPGESVPGCGYLAVFRDLAQNLAQEPPSSHWDERQIEERTARLTRLFASEQMEIFRY